MRMLGENLIISCLRQDENGKEIYQNMKRTRGACKAIVFAIKPTVLWLSLSRRRRRRRRRHLCLSSLLIKGAPSTDCGGAVASWLECSTPDPVVRVRVLAGDIVLCSWARHFTVSLCLSPPRCINGYRRNAGSNPAMDYHPIQGGEEILLVASC